MEVSLFQNTVVLVFALSPEEEMCSKRIPKGTALFKELTEHSLQTVRKTGIPYIHVDEAAQIGATFGERFTGAIQRAFDQGYEHVITIGNDTPKLKASHILDTCHRLQENQFVLGPSTDGGFYLMGLSRSQFDPEIFVDLPWQTATLNSALSAVASSLAITPHKLPLLSDIDSMGDLKQFFVGSDQIPKGFRRLVFDILMVKKTIEPFDLNENYSFLHQNRSHTRGSPLHF